MNMKILRGMKSFLKWRKKIAVQFNLPPFYDVISSWISLPKNLKKIRKIKQSLNIVYIKFQLNLKISSGRKPFLKWRKKSHFNSICRHFTTSFSRSISRPKNLKKFPKINQNGYKTRAKFQTNQIISSHKNQSSNTASQRAPVAIYRPTGGRQRPPRGASRRHPSNPSQWWQTNQKYTNQYKSIQISEEDSLGNGKWFGRWNRLAR